MKKELCISGIFFILFIFLLSCRKESKSIVEPKSYSIYDSTYATFKDIYYWADKLPQERSIEANSVGEFVLKLRTYSPINPVTNLPLDRWSFATDNVLWKKVVEENIKQDWGMGIRFRDQNDLRIAWVQPNSEAGKAGLKRGMRIVSINGINASTEFLSLLNTALDKSSTISLELVNAQNLKYTTVLNKNEYLAKNIIDYKIVNSMNGSDFGYINLFQFLKGADDEVYDAVQFLKSHGIEKLILDLRYNSGGNMDIMENIADLLVPSSLSSKVFYKTKHNHKYVKFDENYYFEGNSSSLNCKEIIVLVGERTASASEILINGLKPYLNIKVLGKPTEGKLMGFYIWQIGGFKVGPVAFLTTNSKNEGDEFSPVIPDLVIEDDVSHDFDINEATINAAIYGMPNKTATSVQSPGIQKLNKWITRDEYSSYSFRSR